MAITTLEQVKSGLQPPVYFHRGQSSGGNNIGWFSGWEPTVGAFPPVGGKSAGLNGAVRTAPAVGALPWTDPPSGNAYLAQFQAAYSHVTAANLYAGVVILCDRLWDNTFDTTSTSLQSIATPTWPARDEDGATAGKGVLLAVELPQATSTNAPTITVTYTNSAGAGGRTATAVLTTIAANLNGSFYWLTLQAGDVGVRSVESIQLSASWVVASGVLVAFRPVAALDIDIGSRPAAIDALTAGMPRLYNGSVLYVLYNKVNTGATNIQGQVQFTWG